MKKISCLLTLIVLTLLVAGCKNNEPKDLAKFEKHLDQTQQKEAKMKQTLNHLDLKQIDQLKEQQMTDKNKKEFNELQTDINSKLMPQMKAYEKSAKKLPAESSKVKHLKQTYLQGVKQKKQKVKDLKTFVDLCNQSVKVNEDILDYTKLFEKKRSLMEENVDKANKHGNKQDVETFTKKVENNNKELKNTAENHINDQNPKKGKKAIEEHIMPLIDKQIKDLNQTTITDSNVNEARKNAIEIYYSLQNYYETRQDTMGITQRLAKIDLQNLPKKGEDLENDDKAFDKELNQLKS